MTHQKTSKAYGDAMNAHNDAVGGLCAAKGLNGATIRTHSDAFGVYSTIEQGDVSACLATTFDFGTYGNVRHSGI